MSKKLIYLICFVLVLGLVMTSVVEAADPDLLVWYKFDETSGTIAHDSSGNGHDGTLNGNPKWVPGQINGALDFGGDGDYVIDADAGAYMNGLSAVTVALWIKSDVIGTDSGFIIFENPQGRDTRNIRYDQDMGGGLLNGIKYGTCVNPGDTADEEDESPPNVQTTEWQHIAVTWASGAGAFPVGLNLYINGVLTVPSDDEPGAEGVLTGYDRVMVGKGGKDDGANEGWDGLVDDVRIYSRVLTVEEIGEVMIGIPPGVASNPSPANESTDVPRDVVLGWTPGEYAPAINGHKVYISENFSDVNDGVGGIAQDANSYARPQRLDLGTTYYWRVDEVNGAPDYTVYEGDLWSFTTEPFAYLIQNIIATASSSGAGREPENTVNGSGLDDSGLLHGKDGDNNMWLSGATGPQPSWIEYEFDNVYKLHEMWVWNYNEFMEPVLGLGIKDASIEYSVDGTDYTTLGTTAEFARAPGAPDYEHNTTIDFGGAAAKYVRLTVNSNWGGILNQYGLSEVLFFHIPLRAREPSPDSGATDVDVDVTLGFRAGREAATHDVYVSADEQAVIDGTAPVTTVTEAGYGPLSLDLGKIYYWKTNEVNIVETPTTLDGEIWNFTTPEFLAVDDFEAYNDLNPEDPESNRIFLAWLDGYGIDTNGSIVGYDAPPFAEQVVVHGGEQAMPLFYNNTGTAAYSEAERTFAVSQNWTKAGIATLVLYFHGTEGNTGQLYVKINDSKVAYDGDVADIATLRWKQWNIDLVSVGANLQNVTKLSIGIDGIGATGTLYVDDIRLYRLAPEIVVPSEEIWIEAEAADTITDPLKIYDDPLASGGQCIGTDQGIGNQFQDNPPAPAGTATYTFTVAGGIYKVSCRIIIPSGDSFWVRIPGATNLTPGENPDNPGTGWVKWSDPDDSNNWYWADVFSADHDATVANWTLPAGTYTLEIARREDGALIDAIVISKID